ncbi:hypothetical protein GQ44DRAFT_47194 [Phaeosphaeriaceae sp. PMI808]|nr:hypothetical protein GQ44DRAFT_47194 [Phaeosphaeriaceae sp. PMI808]
MRDPPPVRINIINIKRRGCISNVVLALRYARFVFEIGHRRKRLQSASISPSSRSQSSVDVAQMRSDGSYWQNHEHARPYHGPNDGQRTSNRHPEEVIRQSNLLRGFSVSTQVSGIVFGQLHGSFSHEGKRLRECDEPLLQGSCRLYGTRCVIVWEPVMAVVSISFRTRRFRATVGCLRSSRPTYLGKHL